MYIVRLLRQEHVHICIKDLSHYQYMYNMITWQVGPLGSQLSGPVTHSLTHSVATPCGSPSLLYPSNKKLES